MLKDNYLYITTKNINNPVVKIWCLLPPTTIAKINEIATTDIICKAVEAFSAILRLIICKTIPKAIGINTT